MPDHATLQIENKLLVMYFPTTIFLDQDLIEYKVVYPLSTQAFNVYVRGDIMLDSALYGLSEYADFDQIFVDGIDTFIKSLVLCKGKNVKIDEKSASGVPEKYTLGVLGHDGQEENRLERWFSRNCIGSMPFLHEHENSTCAKCNRDLNRLDENKKEEEGEDEVMEIDSSNNDLTKSTSISDTSGESHNASEHLKPLDNEHDLDDVKVSIFSLLLLFKLK